MPKFSLWVSTFGGVGLLRHAPGTMGSLASLSIWAPCAFWGLSVQFKLTLLVSILVLGTWTTRESIRQVGRQDPKEIVIDEVVGQGIALLLCPPSWIALGVGFLLFRLFDILKPWPISWIDRQVKGAAGVMLDDVLAGAVACVILNAIF